MLIFTLQGCGSIVYYNLPESTALTEKSIILLETKGGEITEKTGIKIHKINGQLPERNFSASKVELLPGEYKIEFSIYNEAGIAGTMAAGLVGGMVAANTYMYGNKNPNNNTNEFDLTLKGGHIYLVSFSYNEDQEVIIMVEEV